MFALAFLGGGLGAAYFLAFQPLAGMVRSRDWVQTPCQIVSSEFKRQNQSSQVKIVYAYAVDGKEYESDQYCFMAISSNTATRWKRRVVANHPPGKQTVCFVNPSDPMEAVIERGWVPDMWWMLFPIPFLCVGAVSVMVATGAIHFTSFDTPGKPSSWRPEPITDSPSHESFAPAGPVTLKPEMTPFQFLLAASFFALFWNGIVSVFVWQILSKFWRRGFAGVDWFPALFLVPFVLVGIGLCCFAIYTVLSLFNPRPTLVVNSDSIPLGEELQVNWSLSGRPNSIREFKISLKGTEKATYRRGTSTATDEATFAEIVIVETNDPFEMEQGTAKIQIPEHSMHSFDAPNNKVVWSLKIHGEIPWWPDVSASFPITVLPFPIRD
jgi:hypothetical protein